MQKKVWEDFRKKHLGDYHDLYVQIDASLLVDVFENFRNECIKKLMTLILLIFYQHQD